MGRVVLPKLIRKHFGLQTGSLLEIKVSGDHIELTPKTLPPGLREEIGLLLYEGRVGEDAGLLESVRDERDRQNWGF